jgi:hypothetical protein
MRRLLIPAAIVSFLFGGTAGAQTVEQRAQSASDQVIQSMGSSDTLNSNGMKPLASGTPMTTVDGSQQFGAKVSCQASQQFMRVSVLPDASSDIQTIAVDLDPKFTGAFTNSVLLQGPFAAVCNNGVVKCDANSFSNCHYEQWRPDPAAGNATLTEVAPDQLGACYCFNNSCGNNLLWLNSGKVLNDLGAGIAIALNPLYPRLSVSRADQPDNLTLIYYGQNAACGADSTPEQYFSHANDLPAAGAQAANQPGTVAAFMAATPEAAGANVDTIQCAVTRSVALDEVTRDGIISLLSTTNGAWQPAWQTTLRPGCDPATCIDFLVGNNTYHAYNPGNRCVLYPETAELSVARPDRIRSATLWKTQFDDYGQVWVGNSLAFTSAPAWTTPGPFPAPSCETGMDHISLLNTNVTSLFTRATGTLPIAINTATQGQGDGGAYFEVVVNPGCELGPETISDGCAAAAANQRCGVWEEYVDGVQTVRDGLTTGLGPLPSSKTLQGQTCSLSTGNRNWWSTTRTYRCTTDNSGYDFSAVMQRRSTVLNSFDQTTGNYTDRIVNSDGTISNPDGTVTLPPAEVVGCQQTCKTRTAAVGSAVTPSGPQSTLNNTGVAWIFNYKNCQQGVCPLDAGEQLVSACDCTSNFAEAAAMMLTIRQIKQDQTCDQ